MNQILTEVLVSVLSTLLLALLTFVGTKLTKLIDAKVKDTKGNTLLKEATNVVLSAVRATFQTYVESLKKTGAFTSEAQLEALNKAKATILSQLSNEAKNYITNNYGDLNEWISTQIESSINLLKN